MLGFHFKQPRENIEAKKDDKSY